MQQYQPNHYNQERYQQEPRNETQYNQGMYQKPQYIQQQYLSNHQITHGPQYNQHRYQQNHSASQQTNNFSNVNVQRSYQQHNTEISFDQAKNNHNTQPYNSQSMLQNTQNHINSTQQILNQKPYNHENQIGYQSNRNNIPFNYENHKSEIPICNPPIYKPQIDLGSNPSPYQQNQQNFQSNSQQYNLHSNHKNWSIQNQTQIGHTNMQQCNQNQRNSNNQHHNPNEQWSANNFQANYHSEVNNRSHISAPYNQQKNQHNHHNHKPYNQQNQPQRHNKNMKGNMINYNQYSNSSSKVTSPNQQPSNKPGFHNNKLQQPYHNQNNVDAKKVRCEPCDRDFMDERALQAHMKGHTQCEHPGCDFVASSKSSNEMIFQCEHPGCDFVASSKALKLHFVQKHAEGKFRINLQTPEEIRKWREERKRNWPSLANVEVKSKKEKKNQSLGIHLVTNQFSYRGNENKHVAIQRNKEIRHQKRRHEDCNVGENSSQSHMENNAIHNDMTIEKENKVEITDDVNISRDEKKSDGLSLLMNYDGEDGDEIEEIELSTVGHPNSKEPIISVADSKEPITSVVDSKEPVTSVVDLEDGELIENDIDFSSVDELQKNGDNKESRVHNEVSHVHNNESRGLQKNRQRGKKVNKNKGHKKGQQNETYNKKVSLLEMLLAKEIRHERNVILQCVRHIVANNFFE